jgi:hypothetical protein
MRRRTLVGALAVAVAGLIFIGTARAATSPPAGSWLWPLWGPVLRGFEPPPTPFSSGHRGIDIGADFGTPVRGVAEGTVTFAGSVAGSLFVTIDHGDGYRSTSSFVSQIFVRKGQVVSAGQVIALSGRGHPEIDAPQLHFGVRLNGAYVDPIPLLQPRSVVDLIHLAPLDEPPAPGPAAALPRTSVGEPLGAFLSRDLVARERGSTVPGIAWRVAAGRGSARSPPGRHPRA